VQLHDATRHFDFRLLFLPERVMRLSASHAGPVHPGRITSTRGQVGNAALKVLKPGFMT